MTIDEAIKHCLEVAEHNEAKAQKIGVQFLGTTKDREATECRECAADHRQLAEWLTELQQKRDAVKHLSEWNRKLTDYKNEMVCKYGESQEQLAEAKRLLKAAVEDIYKARQGCNCNICDMPPEPTERCQYENGEDCQFKWRYADEALKLIES